MSTICWRPSHSFRYSSGLGWNTFPVPALTEVNKAALTRRAEEILLAREANFRATIAELYDPGAINPLTRATPHSSAIMSLKGRAG